MIRPVALLLAGLVAACGPSYQIPVAPDGGSVATLRPAAGPTRSYSAARSDWNRVAPRIEAVSETFCREENPGRPANYCDFDIRLSEKPGAPPNAFQTIGDNGRPLVVMTSSLLADTRNADEIAFVLAHETGHHIAGHIARQQTNVALGALILGSLAQAAGGGGDGLVSQATDLGAFAGQRAYSQTFELEADTVGAYIAARAGYDPARGAMMFARMPVASGGQSLWSTHPPSNRRLATVTRASEDIRRQQAAGQIPRPRR